MFRLLFSAICISAIVAFASAAFASDGGGDDPEGTQSASIDTASPDTQRRLFDSDHRLELYETSRLERRRALLYSLALPGLGNFYAEQYALGTIALTALVFSAIFVGYGAINGQSQLLRIGLVTTGLTYVGSGISSYIGVQRYNDELRRNLHIESASASQYPPVTTVGWSWRF